MKRGQSALEYLVTYGWAILAIVIIAGVLWYFGIFNPSRFAGENQCGGFSSFTCQDFKVDSTGNLSIVLGNDVGSTITNMAIDGNATSCGTGQLSANQQITCIEPGVIAAGQVGSTFNQIQVNVTYTDQSGLSHTDSGFVMGKYQ